MMSNERQQEEQRIQQILDPPPAFSRSRFVRYALLLLLVPALLYVLMLPLTMLPILRFDRWGGDKWGPVLDFGFHADGQNADVVIFGDSSAAVGVDPRLVDADLGIRSVTLPNTFGSLPVTGDMALRRYLAHNTPPRLIVFYFSPWNLDFQRTGNGKFSFEGEEMLLRNGSWREIAAFARSHPRELLSFPWERNSMLGLQNVLITLRSDRFQQTAAARGHIEYANPIGPLTPPCHIPDSYLQQQNDDSVQTLVHRYATPDTRVVVYLAPVPDCDNADVLLNRSFADLGATPPSILPPQSFAADGLYAHILPGSVAGSSHLFAESLRARAAYLGATRPALSLP